MLFIAYLIICTLAAAEQPPASSPTTTPSSTNSTETTMTDEQLKKKYNEDFVQSVKDRAVLIQNEKKYDDYRMKQIEQQRKSFIDNYKKMKIEEKRLDLVKRGMEPGKKPTLMTDPVWKRIGLPDPTIPTNNTNSTNGTNSTIQPPPHYPIDPLVR
ncbi:hypothetical protein EIN_054670 [Entamoeba invadens IP1]|uniref:hypothetical protein n=1 Tax=Entamoeba invadens IP1 TaxID=370355 RepID=UPI0002C3E3AE|nr:hypothetical protein EIN_054670 [Entamoeba invadens IP1]ELP93182.1 hypothetical protein EIN_054670 [Entamoeba invadens IP1]|eukprot:XP_004259953.1 hypothetical protein EIN_054670 [Entamoeba invadens IP1]